MSVTLQEGRNDICFYAGESGVILEKVVFYSADSDLPGSYLGPEESLAEVKDDLNITVAGKNFSFIIIMCVVKLLYKMFPYVVLIKTKEIKECI